MDQTELIGQLAAIKCKTKVDKLSVLLREQNFALRDLIDLTFHADKIIAFRASWLLENVLLVNPETYLTDLDYLIMRFLEVKYPGCQRHYAKIIMHITSQKAPQRIKDKLQESDLEPVLEKCFDWMIDPEILIAVKVFSSEAIFNLHHRYYWIAEELGSQLQFLMKNGSPAIQARGRKLLSMLSK